MTLTSLQSEWVNEPEWHVHINDLFTELVNRDDRLREHRDWVQNNIFGFGEKSFWWLWKLICEELEPKPVMCEVGVFKSATLSLWRLLVPNAIIIGISPMNGDGTGWTEDNYWGHLETIHNRFRQDTPIIFEGYSEQPEVIEKASIYSGIYNVMYLDGGHSFETVTSDLTNYAPMVKQGGFLVMDDCACDMNFPNNGVPQWYFTGIADVQRAFDEYMSAHGAEWEFVANVVHLRVMRKI